ncbi:hypothetical protein [Winogradskyella sp.]|uniref:hypothetical protein n=1 Tax=Winogradskyella sp. TaxID=1883156 RepID=UPI003AB4265D
MKRLLFMLVSLSVLVACSSNNSDDFNEPNDLSGAYLTAKVNGEDFVVEGNSILTGVYAQLVESNSVFVFGIGATTFDDGFNARVVSLALGGLDFDMVVAGGEYYAQQGDLTVAGYYNEQNTNDTYLSSESNMEAYVKITTIDKINRVVSGEFQFVSIDDDNSNITYAVTDGVFNEIEYVTE